MIHYSCDRCKQTIDSQQDLRYTVRIEAQAAMEPVDSLTDEDRDYLLEIHEVLERLDDVESELVSEDIYQRQRYDLCSECYQKFISNPVGAELPSHVGFSQN
jgi:hypothetical protein